MIITRSDYAPDNAERLAWFRWQYALIRGPQFNLFNFKRKPQ